MPSSVPLPDIAPPQDIVVGYMGVPKQKGVDMSHHPQYITVRYFSILAFTCLTFTSFVSERTEAFRAGGTVKAP